MAFLPEYYGFERVKVLRLQEPVQLDQVRRVSIHDVLGGVSPDYAIVAQKQAPTETLQLVSQAFAQEYGVTLAMLSGRYEQDKDDEFRTLNQALQTLDTNFNQNLRHEITTLDHELNLLVQRVDSHSDHRLALLEQNLQHVHGHLQRFDQHLQRIESRRVI